MFFFFFLCGVVILWWLVPLLIECWCGQMKLGSKYIVSQCFTWVSFVVLSAWRASCLFFVIGREGPRFPERWTWCICGCSYWFHTGKNIISLLILFKQHIHSLKQGLELYHLISHIFIDCYILYYSILCKLFCVFTVTLKCWNLWSLLRNSWYAWTHGMGM